MRTPDHFATSTPATDRADAERSAEDARRERTRFRRALRCNLILNAAWSWSFFQSKNLPLATANAALLAVSSGDLASRADRQGHRYGIPLFIYAAWCGFATVLSWRIWRLND